jgi:hypothetical protein
VWRAPPSHPAVPEGWNRLAEQLRAVIVERVDQLLSMLENSAPSADAA